MKSSISFLTILFLLLAGVANADVQKLTVDTNESRLSWVGKKVLGQHDGYLLLKDGVVEMKDGKIESGVFSLDMSTITNKDIADPNDKAKLEGHLKSDDFFNVSEFPEGTFEITSANEVKPGEVELTGNLTVKGIKVPVTFPATISQDGETYRAKAEVVIDRSKWDIRFNSKSFFDPKQLGDKLIYDDIKITLDIVAKPMA